MAKRFSRAHFHACSLSRFSLQLAVTHAAHCMRCCGATKPPAARSCARDIGLTLLVARQPQRLLYQGGDVFWPQRRVLNFHLRARAGSRGAAGAGFTLQLGAGCACSARGRSQCSV